MFRSLPKVLMLLLLLGLSVGAAFADPFSLSGNWDYTENGGDEVESAWRFNESYSLSAAKDLTAASDLTASFRYTKSQRQAGDDAAVMSPSATWGVRNDLFSLNLSGSQSQRQTNGGSETTSQNWDVTLFSLLEEKWPGMRLTYGESRRFDDQSPRGQDTESDNLGVSFDYSWPVVDLYYDYRIDTSHDHLATSETESEQHFAKIEYVDNFLQGKVSVSLSQQYQRSDTEINVQVATGESLFLPVSFAQTFSALDDTPLDGALVSNPVLSDGDTVTASMADIAQPIDLNLGVQTSLQPVSQFRVYLDQEITLLVQSQLSWALYTSDGSAGWSWDLVGDLLPVSYLVEDGRTVVVVDVPGPELLEQYVKLVASFSGFPSPVYVTELQAGTSTIATDNQVVSTSEFVSYQTRASISYRPAPGWSLAYNMTRNQNKPDPGLESTQLSQALSANYVPGNGFSMSASLSEHRDEAETREETLNRSYALSAQQQLWETMNLSMGYTHSDRYEDSRKKTRSDSLSGYLNARLFPDLSASLNMNWSQSENLLDGNDSRSYGWRLNSTARLTPRVDITAFLDYNENQSEGEEADSGSDTTRYGFNLNMRPSAILSFNASLNRDVEEKSTTFVGSVAWRLTPKIQTSLSSSRDLEEGDLESYSGSVNWLVSPHFSLRGSAGWQQLENVVSWSWRLNANATF